MVLMIKRFNVCVFIYQIEEGGSDL